MSDKDRSLTLTLDNGKEVECEILFTYHSDEFNKNYVVFLVKETNEVSAAIYNEHDELSGSLDKIETDAEWEMLEELLDEYQNQANPTPETCNGACEGCHGCDNLDDEQ